MSGSYCVNSKVVNRKGRLSRLVGIVLGLVILSGLVIVRPFLNYSNALSRGEALTQKGDYDAAFFAFGDAIRRSPNDPVPYFKRAVAMSKAMKHSKAQIDLNEVIRLSPNFGPAYRLRANAYRAQGLESKASEDDGIADRFGAAKDFDAICQETPS